MERYYEKEFAPSFCITILNSSTSSTPNAEHDRKQIRHLKSTTPANPKKKKDKEFSSSIFRKLFGKSSRQTDSTVVI